MHPEVAARLRSIVRSIHRTDLFIVGLDYPIYANVDHLHCAVERQLEIIGANLSIASRLDPTLADAVPCLRDIVALRGRISQADSLLDTHMIWMVTQRDLPALRAQVLAVLR